MEQSEREQLAELCSLMGNYQADFYLKMDDAELQDTYLYLLEKHGEE